MEACFWFLLFFFLKWSCWLNDMTSQLDESLSWGSLLEITATSVGVGVFLFAFWKCVPHRRSVSWPQTCISQTDVGVLVIQPLRVTRTLNRHGCTTERRVRAAASLSLVPHQPSNDDECQDSGFENFLLVSLDKREFFDTKIVFEKGEVDLSVLFHSGFVKP